MNDPEHEIRSKAVELLSRREHTRLELERKLTRRGFEPEGVDRVLDDLARENLLSESRFVSEFVRQRAARGFGPIRIRYELEQRGIGGSLLAEGLDDGDPEWCRRAAAARVKRFGEGAPEATAERARQSRFLARRGFTSEQIRGALVNDPGALS